MRNSELVALCHDLHVDEPEKVAALLGAMLRSETAPEDVSEKCRAWVAQCHNEPSFDEKVLCAADDLLGTHGVEGCTLSTGEHVEYCNTGDTYCPTLCLVDGCMWRVASWGDLVEEADNEKARDDMAHEVDEARADADALEDVLNDTDKLAEHVAREWKGNDLHLFLTALSANLPNGAVSRALDRIAEALDADVTEEGRVDLLERGRVWMNGGTIFNAEGFLYD